MIDDYDYGLDTETSLEEFMTDSGYSVLTYLDSTVGLGNDFQTKEEGFLKNY